MIDDPRKQSEGVQQEPPGDAGAETEERATNGSGVMAVDALEGNAVVNASGEKLGTVQRIIVDVPGGVLPTLCSPGLATSCCPSRGTR